MATLHQRAAWAEEKGQALLAYAPIARTRLLGKVAGREAIAFLSIASRAQRALDRGQAALAAEVLAEAATIGTEHFRP